MATFYNRATLTYNGMSVASNLVTGQIAEVLSITKTALLPTYKDDPITYIVTLANSGAQDFTGVTVTDDLGAYEFGRATVYPLSYVANSLTAFENGAPIAAPTVSADAGLAISGVTVPAGGNVVLVYAALPTEYAPRAAGEGITNTAAAAGGGLVSPLSAEATVLAATEAELTIVKSVSPDVVSENGTLTYAFEIANRGAAPAEAEAEVVVSDVFDPILTNLAVTLDGTPLARTTGYTYDEATGQFATVAGAITVPAATVSQDPETGVYSVTPGSVTLVVSGTV